MSPHTRCRHVKEPLLLCTASCFLSSCLCSRGFLGRGLLTLLTFSRSCSLLACSLLACSLLAWCCPLLGWNLSFSSCSCSRCRCNGSLSNRSFFGRSFQDSSSLKFLDLSLDDSVPLEKDRRAFRAGLHQTCSMSTVEQASPTELNSGKDTTLQYCVGMMEGQLVGRVLSFYHHAAPRLKSGHWASILTLMSTFTHCAVSRAPT